ncbi:MAG: DNA-deoxyinosine glycosylase [Phenylobacterium sp.]|uniref:DNA-deoxyinosine glycosylase n=1 Tax=Phenylobacterium sp. TaxID=1871053 RepID=UPI002717F3D1|nr:DNA-deoxyinosine glycosylase [Phenylobacterium sp.]MDO8900800.1 DNA-deoxyinosine glycosylase [Phenylobacterium sp.]
MADHRTRVLILGSLPGEASLAKAQYYAHPRNQFWRLVEAATERPLPEGYESRLGHLLEIGVGLWDTIGSARRRGSLDGALRDIEANPLAEMVEGLSNLQAVAFNGLTATRLGRRQLATNPRLSLISLPSSSPAHTLDYEAKLARWREIRRHLPD